jgi:hypothetical protein
MPRTENMEPVYKKLQSLPDFENTTVVTFEKAEVYALQFYLQGKLRCSTAEAEMEPWEEPVTKVVDEIIASPPGKHWVFFCSPKRGDLLEAGLKEKGFVVERSELRKWSFIRIVAVPRAAGAATGS